MTENDTQSKPPQRRRGHNEGSIYPTKNGGYRGAVFIGYGIDGKPQRKYVSGKTHAEVNRKVTELLGKQQRGLPIAGKSPTVSVFLDQWLEDVVKPNERPRTYEAYETIVRIHLKPAIDRHKIEKLTAAHIQSMLSATKEAGAAGRALLNIRGVIRAALNQAMKWDLVARNVATLTEPPELGDFEPKPFSAEELALFVDVIKGDRLEVPYATAVWLGLRSSELLGLRWQDVDFDRGTITIAKQLYRPRTKPHTPSLVDPKTKRSKRQLPLPQPLATALKAHRRRQLEEIMLAGSRWHREWDLVFCSTIGTPLDQANVLKLFRALLKTAKLGERRFHDLRHSCGTFLAINKVPVAVAQQILGHAQASTTLNIYSRIPNLDPLRDALDSMKDTFGEDSNAVS